MKYNWVKDNDPHVPAHVLVWYSFKGEVFKSNTEFWGCLIWITNERGVRIEQNSSDHFNTMKAAKEFVEKALVDYQTAIVASIGKI